MMMRRDHLHDRFVRAVHRRLVLVRALERGGICTAVAGGFSLVAALVLMSRGADALPLSGFAMMLGAGIGLVWGLVRRPGLMEAASEADRQFGLSDLLSSALGARGEDGWSRAVVSMADQRCRSLRSNEVVLHRLGGRAWGGIGLSLALVLTVGVMSNVMMQERSAARSTEMPERLANPSDRGAQSKATKKTPGAKEVPAISDRTGERPEARQAEEGSQSFEDQANEASESSASSSDRANLPYRESDGDGERPSSSDSAIRQPMPEGAGGRGNDSDLNADVVSGEGVSARGEQTSSRDGASAGGLGARSSAADSLNSKALPWQSRQWSVDRASAMHAVESGRVPDRSRDVVRAYFNGRDGSGSATD